MNQFKHEPKHLFWIWYN